MTNLTDTITPDAAPPRRLVRRREGRWAGGVCAGLAEHFGIDPIVFRVSFAALALAGGGGIVLYLAAWLVIPDEGSEDSIAVEILRERRDRPWALAGIALVALAAAFALSGAHVWPHEGGLWLAALLLGGGLLWWNARRYPGAGLLGRRRGLRGSMLPAVAGLLLAWGGVLGLLSAGGVDVDARAAFAGGAVVAAVGVIAGLVTARRVAGSLLLGLVMLTGFAAVATARVPLSAGVGDRLEQPTTVAALQPSYQLGVGDLELDLRQLALAGGTTHVVARVGIGDLRIEVPRGVRVTVRGRVTVGRADLLGRERDGARVSQRVIDPGLRGAESTLDVDAFVGVGHIEVVR